MKQFRTLAAVAALVVPTFGAVSVTAQEAFQVGETYICPVGAIRSNTSICAAVSMPSPPADVCITVLSAGRYSTSPVVLSQSGVRQCTLPAGLLDGAAPGATTGGTVASNTATGGLAGGAGGAIIAGIIGAALIAGAGGGSSNGTN